MSGQQDQGYAWVVLIACFLFNNIKAGNYLVGIFLLEFQQNLSVSRVAVSWAGGLHLFVGPICGIFLGPVTQRCGVRLTVIVGSLLIAVGFLVPAFMSNMIVVYIGIGVLASIGYIVTYNATILVIQQYFSRRRALANGLFMAGFSTGMLMIPPLLRLTMDTYGWRGGLVVMAAIVMQSIVLGALLRPLPNTKAQKNRAPSQAQNVRSLMTSVPFILFLLAEFGISIGFRTVMLYTPMRCDMIGIPKSDVAWLMSTIGLASLVAYPVFGLLADQPWVDEVLLYGFGAVVSGVVTIVTGSLYQFSSLLIGMILLSAFIVTASGAVGPVLRSIVGVEELEIALGIRTSVVGVSNIVFNISSGYIFDNTGNANLPFYVFGALQVASGFIPVVIFLMKRSSHRARNTSVTIG